MSPVCPKNRQQRALLCVLLMLMHLVGFFQIYIFHSQTTQSDGTLHLKGPQAQTSTDSKVTISSSQHQTDVIVYLAQFGNFHSSYGLQKDASKRSITGLSKLNKSIELLYTNYVNDFPSCDILIFYDTEHRPDNETIVELSSGRPQLQFRELKGEWWSLPHGLKPIDRFKWNRPAFR